MPAAKDQCAAERGSRSKTIKVSAAQKTALAKERMTTKLINQAGHEGRNNCANLAVSLPPRFEPHCWGYLAPQRNLTLS
jgi:hypothetical protein